MADPPRCVGAWLRPAHRPRGYVDPARQLARRGKRRPCRVGGPDPLDEWTVDGFHPGPQRAHDSMPVAVAGNEPPLPRGGIADLTGRVPAGRPIRQPPAHQVTAGADRIQRLVVDVQRDEALLEVSRAAVEAFGEWPRPWTLVAGSAATADRLGFGGMRRDHRLP